MKKSKLLCALIAAAGVFASCTVHKPVEKPKFITVNAAASVTEKADTAELAFSVVSAGWVAKKVIEDNLAAVNRVTEAAKAAGVLPDDIKTSPLVFEPYKIDPRQYAAGTVVKITLRNPERLGDIIDAAKTPAMPVPSLVRTVSDSAEAFRAARAEAMQKAKEKAALLAGAGGCRIGEVLSIEELHESEKSRRTADTDGNLVITAELRVTFAIES